MKTRTYYVYGDVYTVAGTTEPVAVEVEAVSELAANNEARRRYRHASYVDIHAIVAVAPSAPAPEAMPLSARLAARLGFQPAR